MDAGFGVRIALHTHCLAGAFARTRVCRGSLAAHRQAAHVAHPAVTLDALEPLEIQTNLTAEVTLDDILALLDRVNDLGKLVLIQVLRAQRRVNVRLLEDGDRVDRADAVNVSKRDINPLLTRNIYSKNTCHKIVCLTLTLFVACVRANNPNHALALHNFAVLAQLLN